VGYEIACEKTPLSALERVTELLTQGVA